MHQTRAEVSMRIPIERKGNKYVARSLGSLENSVPLVIAIRDMLNLARNKKEVDYMIHHKLLKINGKEVKNYRHPIYLFNILEAGKHYMLSLTANGKFTLEEVKKSSTRLCKVIGKKVLKNKTVQLNLHDGTNILSNDKIAVGDSVHVDEKGKISKHLPVEKGKECMITTGKYVGAKAKIDSAEGNYIDLTLSSGGEKIQTSINKSNLMVI